MKRQARRTCSRRSNRFSAALEFCPVCMVRMAIDWEAESGELSSEDEAADLYQKNRRSDSGVLSGPLSS